MTVEHAKKMYGDPERNYYVRCHECPIHPKCIDYLDGYDECWERIAESATAKPDNVNHPAHYETGKFECIDVMVETQGEEAVKAYCLCAAFKYLYRHKRKNGLEDIKKARWYLDKYLELEDGSDDKN